MPSWKRLTARGAPATRPDFGLDAPGGLVAAWSVGAALVAVGVAFRIADWPAASLVGLAVWPGIALLVYGAVHLYASKVGKRRDATRMLDRIRWSGDEAVLDVGCGHGLLLCGAAARLTTGRAIGIDVWSQKDQWRNTPEATRHNARLLGVADRVEVLDGDARQLDFPDETFDVVVSSFVIHNIPTADGRARAMREIARVLRPGGQVAILDIAHTRRYAKDLASAGLVDVTRSPAPLAFLPTAGVVTGHKPGA